MFPVSPASSLLPPSLSPSLPPSLPPRRQVRAKYSEDGVWYDATLQGEKDGLFWVVYDEFGNSEGLSLGQIELKNAPRGCPGNAIDPLHADDVLWYVPLHSPAYGAWRPSLGCACVWCPPPHLSHTARLSFTPGSKLTDEELLERLLETEKDGAVASGKDYATRPSGYKRMLSMKMDR
jgi:hypothetical protein